MLSWEKTSKNAKSQPNDRIRYEGNGAKPVII